MSRHPPEKDPTMEEMTTIHILRLQVRFRNNLARKYSEVGTVSPKLKYHWRSPKLVYHLEAEEPLEEIYPADAALETRIFLPEVRSYRHKRWRFWE